MQKVVLAASAAVRLIAGVAIGSSLAAQQQPIHAGSQVPRFISFRPSSTTCTTGIL
jgi:hypothetical protein